MRHYLNYFTIPFLIIAVVVLVRAIRKPRDDVYRRREILEAAATCLMAVGFAVSTDQYKWLRILLVLAALRLMPDVRDIYDGRLATMFPKRRVRREPVKREPPKPGSGE